MGGGVYFVLLIAFYVGDLKGSSVVKTLAGPSEASGNRKDIVRHKLGEDEKTAGY